jgi:hypothetical protein
MIFGQRYIKGIGCATAISRLDFLYNKDFEDPFVSSESSITVKIGSKVHLLKTAISLSYRLEFAYK